MGETVVADSFWAVVFYYQAVSAQFFSSVKEGI